MKKIISVLLLTTLVFISASLVIFSLFLSGYEVHRNLEYGELDCEIMDIYIPKSAYEKKSSGCVLFIHGGSWSGGDKKEEELRCRNVANQGYIAATMNYTLYNPDASDNYDVGIVLDEIDMALEYIKSFTAERGIKVENAATSGYSAGAHLSMLYSYSRGDTAPIDIKFTANMAGPADIDVDIWGKDLTHVIGEMLSGKELAEEEILNGGATDVLSSISPVTYVTENSPPSIFIYGGKDTTVPIGNWKSLERKFNTVGAKYDFVFLPDADHSLMKNLITRLEYSKLLISYCEKYFE